MANWKYRLDIKKEWHECKNGEITHVELGHIIAKKLRNKFFELIDDEDLQDIIDDFDHLEGQSINAFDYCMEQLYDWGDTELPSYGAWPRNKFCWIATFCFLGGFMSLVVDVLINLI